MSYGYWGHLKRYGNGENAYRGLGHAQPRALEVGDILMTGEKVTRPTEEGYNGAVRIWIDGTDILVPARIPIAIRRTGKK